MFENTPMSIRVCRRNRKVAAALYRHSKTRDWFEIISKDSMVAGAAHAARSRTISTRFLNLQSETLQKHFRAKGSDGIYT
jgi:hypothetical protein